MVARDQAALGSCATKQRRLLQGPHMTCLVQGFVAWLLAAQVGDLLQKSVSCFKLLLTRSQLLKLRSSGSKLRLDAM